MKQLELRENALEHVRKRYPCATAPLIRMQVPLEIGSLTSLERLNLSKNKITSVPGEVQHTSKFQVLMIVLIVFVGPWGSTQSARTVLGRQQNHWSAPPRDGCHDKATDSLTEQ